MPKLDSVWFGWLATSMFAAILGFLFGCNGSSNHITWCPMSRWGAPIHALTPADREAIARCFPGVNLSEGVRVRFNSPHPPHLVTAEEALAEVGAHVGEDGKVHDWDGKEVRFWRNPLAGRGTPYSAEEQRATQDELDKLKRQYHVIEIDYYPGEENGGPLPPAFQASGR